MSQTVSLTEKINDGKVNYFVEKLNNYPHIQRNVLKLWGSQKCSSYLASLTIVSPDRTDRQGFPLEDLETIKNLIEMHDDMFPKFSNPPAPFDFPI